MYRDTWLDVSYFILNQNFNKAKVLKLGRGTLKLNLKVTELSISIYDEQ